MVYVRRDDSLQRRGMYTNVRLAAVCLALNRAERIHQKTDVKTYLVLVSSDRLNHFGMSDQISAGKVGMGSGESGTASSNA
eukprot:scaffold69283_cov25-Prasinocladus_malaysianus.AAC.2